jgi:GT2 family glycosyltransferase
MSGFCTDFGETPFPINRPERVEFLPGAAFSFRRQVFKHYAFCPGFRDNALGEDKDFSVRVGRRYDLVLQPRARLYHYESERMRPGKRDWGRKLLLGRYLLFREYARARASGWIFFLFASFGYLLERILIAAIRWDWSQIRHVLGLLDGMRAILLGKIEMEDAEPQKINGRTSPERPDG